MPDIAVAPAPAQVESTAPETVSADTAAVEARNFGDFKAAHDGAKRGQPLPDVPAPAEKPFNPPQISKRQERANEAVRVAAEKAVADAQAADRAEIARLRAELQGRTPPRPEPVQQPPGPVEAPKTFDDAIRRPDLSAALMTEAKFFETYPDAPYSAYSRYATQYDLGVSRQADQRRAEQTTVQEAQQHQISGFVAQLNAAAAADPTFATSLSPDVAHHLKPFAAVNRAAGEVAGPINVIGEQVYASDIAPQMLRYFSAHPEELTRITAMPASLATLPPALREPARINWMIREYGKLEGRVAAESPAAETPEPEPEAAPPTTTALPPPPPTLSRAGGAAKDSFESAIARKDVGRALKLDLQERIRRRNGTA